LVWKEFQWLPGTAYCLVMCVAPVAVSTRQVPYQGVALH
jgi:hypothetical protein